MVKEEGRVYTGRVIWNGGVSALRSQSGAIHVNTSGRGHIVVLFCLVLGSITWIVWAFFHVSKDLYQEVVTSDLPGMDNI